MSGLRESIQGALPNLTPDAQVAVSSRLYMVSRALSHESGAVRRQHPDLDDTSMPITQPAETVSATTVDPIPVVSLVEGQETHQAHVAAAQQEVASAISQAATAQAKAAGITYQGDSHEYRLTA